MYPSVLSLLAAATALALVGCSGETSATSTGSSSSSTVPTVWTDTAMQQLVATKCATPTCHGGAERPSLRNISEEDMRANTEALREVRAGRMPKRGSLTKDELATFLAFYDNGN